MPGIIAAPGQTSSPFDRRHRELDARNSEGFRRIPQVGLARRALRFGRQFVGSTTRVRCGSITAAVVPGIRLVFFVIRISLAWGFLMCQFTGMLSFIVPAHNEELLLGNTLAAIHTAARDAWAEYELIVVDDASTDGYAGSRCQ